MRKMWPVLAALVVLTSACRLETNITIDVADDGSGVFTTELGVDQEMADVLEGFGGSADLLGNLDIGDGTTETRIEGEMTYVSSSQAFTSVDELTALVEENNDQASFETFELVVDEAGARILAKTAALAGQDGVDTESLPFDLSTLGADVFAANVVVRLPGKITEHNADEQLGDGSLRWKISVTDPIDIEAQSTFGGGGIPWLPIGIAAVAILGIGAFLAGRGKEDKATVALSSTVAPPAPMDLSISGPTGAGVTEAIDEAGIPPELPPGDQG